MAQIAYILLSHKDPDGIIAQVRRLTTAGDFVSIHYDGRAAQEDFDKITAAFVDNPAVVFAKKRIKCGWGEWSLVEATIQALRSAEEAFPRATHFYMLSGDCMPIKTGEYAREFLERRDVDYIESFDFFKSDWIKTGIKEERLIYRHFFNERTHKVWFYRSMEWQKALGLTRKVPADLTMQIGSQWWVLRRTTVEKLLIFIQKRRDVLRFFRTTWIPDETFFQTLVHHLVPANELVLRPLTFLMFTDYGMPVTFYNDHYELLVSQDYLFARKISPDAIDLKTRLGDLYGKEGLSFTISNEGRSLFRFLTGRGRIGRRFAPRFWERETSIGRDRTLLIVACKKWHVGKRLVDRARQVGQRVGTYYLFNEESTPLPDLGGIETNVEKRMRHRRALVRMLYEHWDSDSLMICIDPGSVDLIQDFYSDRATVRLLEMECAFSDDYLIGHAKRVGLAADNTPPATLARLLPTIRYDIKFEGDQIREYDFPGYGRLREGADLDEKTRALMDFLAISESKAREIASTPYLFVD